MATMFASICLLGICDRLDVYTQTQIDPMVGFRNAQGESARGTIVNLQRKSLVMEVYTPHSIILVSEVLSEFTVRLGTKSVYVGKAVVVSMVNTGLTAVVSVTLIDEWQLGDPNPLSGALGNEAKIFIRDWAERFRIRADYQIKVNEMRAFLSDAARWVDQIDISQSLPKENGCLRDDVFYELAEPLILQIKSYVSALEGEALQVKEEFTSAHRSFTQSMLHPLILRAPFVFRTYTKPLGYAGDYQMVRQMVDDPKQGPSTYFQIINTAFLQSAAVVAHRNRIEILVDFLKRLANFAREAGRPFRVLNIGCGPAFEIQRFLQRYPDPELLSFELVDFSDETLQWTREQITSILAGIGKSVSVSYAHDSVYDLIKRRLDPKADDGLFDAVYCAGLFDYLSDKVCKKLLQNFAARTRQGGMLLVTNVHPDNPEKVFAMEHLAEWYLIYRDEAKMNALLPERTEHRRIYADETGVNIFAEATIT